jgi:hypothetical protein
MEERYVRTGRNGRRRPVRGVWTRDTSCVWRKLDSRGYWLERCPAHPLARRDAWVLAGRRVLWDLLGDGWHPCHGCGEPVSWGETEWVERLHVVRLDGRNGNDDVSNLVAACGPCSRRKSRGLEMLGREPARREERS